MLLAWQAHLRCMTLVQTGSLLPALQCVVLPMPQQHKHNGRRTVEPGGVEPVKPIVHIQVDGQQKAVPQQLELARRAGLVLQHGHALSLGQCHDLTRIEAG